MPNPKYEKLQVNGFYLREAPSGKAFHMAICDEDGEELKRQWFPHSQVKFYGTDDKVEAEYKETISVGVPMWLAENEGIAKLLRDQTLNSEYGADEDYGDDICF